MSSWFPNHNFSNCFRGFFALDCHSVVHFVNVFYSVAVLIHCVTQVKQLYVFHKDMVVFNQKLCKIKTDHHRSFLQSPCETFMEHCLRISALFSHSLLGKLCLLFHLCVFWMCVLKVILHSRIRCHISVVAASALHVQFLCLNINRETGSMVFLSLNRQMLN